MKMNKEVHTEKRKASVTRNGASLASRIIRNRSSQLGAINTVFMR